MKWNEMKMPCNENENEHENENENEIKWMHARMNESINQAINEICRPHLPKVLRTRQFFPILMWNRAHAAVLCTFLSTTFADRGPKPRNGDPTSATTEATLPQKKVSRPKLFSSLNSRDSRPVTLPNYLMMMLLTWWWECCPWQSSVTRKFSYQTSFDIQTLGRFGTGNKPGAARIANRVPTRTPNGASKSYSRQARIYVEYIRV